MLAATLEVLWHPPLLAHKASPGTLALLLAAPGTRLSFQLTNWNVLFFRKFFLKESNFQSPNDSFKSHCPRCLDIGDGYFTATFRWHDKTAQRRQTPEDACVTGNAEMGVFKKAPRCDGEQMPKLSS